MVAILIFYTLCGYLYYFVSLNILKNFKELRSYYRSKWAYIALLPLYNMMTFFIRMAGIINSIKTPGSWKTDTLTEERHIFKKNLREDMNKVRAVFRRFADAVNDDTLTP
jgi:hypothetical protein